MSGKTPFAALISGRGSNMRALLEAARAPDFPARCALVLSNNPDAAGLDDARKADIPALAIDHRDHASREAHERAIDAALREAGTEWICLAGYMRLLTPWLVEAWAGRILNIHPALLPAFKGLDTHERALKAGARIHGCATHIVTAGMDEGPIIGQAALAVRHDDNPQSLARRVLALEHRLYPQTLRLMAMGAARLEGGRVIFRDARAAASVSLIE